VEYISFDPRAPNLAVAELSAFLGSRYEKEKERDFQRLALFSIAVLILMASE
jgi:hypothetical protein